MKPHNAAVSNLINLALVHWLCTGKYRYLKSDELRLLWNHFADDNSSRILKLQLLTGCKAGEVCGMRESELDRDANEWVLPSSRTKTPGLT